MRKFVNIVLAICVIMLVVVIGVVIYSVRQNTIGDTTENSTTSATETKPDTISNPNDLIKALNSQADEEFDYFQGMDDESSLADNDAQELSNVSKAYEENDF
ncbi:hypothetical protein CO101_00755 [Candidatus Berkelbacteria bacterium CG_4_9_14_3_um_filter_39_23]|uniref:Uncharacterized protein n=2 Tax=Candidatus Berkelbacteria TaxID=1618330 RepID=A0A2M7CI60_9BACT|nr:hypothetical protein [Candidatus Berkelbacteria bacterium]OIP05862.1 MAG: hypothetical protein AUK14_00915 [Candidatus Berkelbacteria bacterium CG2_30_39_44]PIR27980.1 MAG: hypothetical protein COV39_01620 [Candidatus Berkelbacteria bacterium CG11_big_fil_rev_8_21_14_0_20_40_23]PIV25332.1 MAG: hypothetical protein COS38_02135 [Candidatus Berkelbacteria bacterium CG03_land_8_20_14_0_80_40_36]PIX30395.1 MAG: hypothetical protein COZ62_02860 [Candidatus Berkelbacteria bacterium CG_4_8_14_3_um_f